MGDPLTFIFWRTPLLIFIEKSQQYVDLEPNTTRQCFPQIELQLFSRSHPHKHTHTHTLLWPEKNEFIIQSEIPGVYFKDLMLCFHFQDVWQIKTPQSEISSCFQWESLSCSSCSLCLCFKGRLVSVYSPRHAAASADFSDYCPTECLYILMRINPSS